MVQGPWARFGDTFANSGTLALLDSVEHTRDLNIGSKTLLASAAASSFRIIWDLPFDSESAVNEILFLKSSCKFMDFSE